MEKLREKQSSGKASVVELHIEIPMLREEAAGVSLRRRELFSS